MIGSSTRLNGSSPLTRGKRIPMGTPHRRHRLIPAHAGKTNGQSSTVGVWGAHPRSRGENTGRGQTYFVNKGSSPLTRGKRLRETIAAAKPRLIPAHAGKTRTCPHALLPPSAHPRSRGENAITPLMATWSPGSSPLTRGKRGIGCNRSNVARLIPAHAGKTWVMLLMCVSHTAHPRSRGENVPASWDDPLACGSSPLTRGKPERLHTRGTHPGLIPAHAGKTLAGEGEMRRSAAHPRSRGENVKPVA